MEEWDPAVVKLLSIFMPTSSDPDWTVDKPTRKRRGRPSRSGSMEQLNSGLRDTNTRQLTLEILRKAQRPITLRECANAFAERHGDRDR